LIDADGSGLINAEELRMACKSLKLNMPQEEIREIIQNADYHGNQKINYTEFLAATMNTQK
jgi:Ca2+-binding EF-hand superfamily protein